MMRRTHWLLAMAVLCGLGPAVVCMAAEPKTGPTRDTLLYVRTDPPGANVLLDGKELGKSDGLFPVRPGVSTILVELEGREPTTKQVTIRANGITRVEMVLHSKAPEPPTAQAAEERAVREVAQRWLAAVRDSDDATLQAACCDLEALGYRDGVPVFAKEIREKLNRLWHSTDRLNQIDAIFVKSDFAAVKAATAKNPDGACLMLFFALTPDGWRNFSLRAAPVNASPDDKLAAELAFVENALKKRAAAFVDLLTKGKFGDAVTQFNDQMRKTLPEIKLAENHRELDKAGGKFLGQDPSRVEKVAEYFAVYVPCRWERNKLDLKVVFDLTGQISGLWTLPPASAAGEDVAGKQEGIPGPGPAAENILTNPGIETGDEAPNSWDEGAPIPGVTYSRDKKAGYQSSASLCIEKTANRYFPIAQWSQTVERKGDRPELEVSAQVKAQKMHKATLDVLFLDKDGQWIKHQWAAYIGAKQPGDPPANHDWKKYSGTVEIPAGTAKISIGLQVYGPGKVWFDDVQARYVK